MTISIVPADQVDKAVLEQYLNNLFFDYGVPEYPIKTTLGTLYAVMNGSKVDAVFYVFERKDESKFLGPVLSHYDAVLDAIKDWSKTNLNGQQ